MLKSPCSSRATPSPPEDSNKMRRVIAEDPDWSLMLIPFLSTLCLESIARDMQKNPIYTRLNPIQREFVQKRLSVSLPLRVTANLISDDVYWKRCCEQRWAICDVAHYGDSWKRMFFERHLENMVELFIPDVTETKTIRDMIPLCKNYVKRLEITQLLPPIKEPRKEEDEYGADFGDSDYEEPSIDHFDFSILLGKLDRLEEFHVVYRVKECGMNFEWEMFAMTDRDCECLAKALKSCKTLKRLRLHQSNIEDKQCRLLVKNLLDHPSLRELDFSHNLIGDRGARAVGKLLGSSQLQVLNMYDNNIRDPGAKAIAHALSKNSTLLSLNLQLNRLKDEGGKSIGQALVNNNTLLHLHLGANEVTGASAVAISKALLQNNTLKTINLSSNKLGVEGGKALREALSTNTSVTECDMRLTEVDEADVSFINQVVWANQQRQAQQKKSK